MLSTFLQAMYNAVDMFFVGKFAGTAALAAVAVGGPIMNIMIMTISGFSVGVSIVIGSHIGSGKSDSMVRACANTAITMYLLLALIGGTVGVLFTPTLARMVHTPPEAMVGAIDYLRVIFGGIVFMFGYNLICALQRGFGDSKTSLYFVIIAAIINIVLDYILVGILNMGPLGAAIATVFAQACSMIAGIVFFRRKKHVVSFDPRQFRIHKVQMQLIIRMGFPAAIQQLLINISNTTMTGLANSFGLAASAAYGIANKISSFALLPSDASGLALSTFASQNVGAAKPDRAIRGLKETLKLSFSVSLLSLGTVAATAVILAGWFDSDPEVIAIGASFLRASTIANLMLSLIMPMIGFVRGTGNSIYTMFAVILAQYIIRIPVSFFFCRFMGFNGMAYASALSCISSGGLYTFAIVSGRWRNSREVKRSLELNKRAEAQDAGSL